MRHDRVLRVVAARVERLRAQLHRAARGRHELLDGGGIDEWAAAEDAGEVDDRVHAAARVAT